MSKFFTVLLVFCVLFSVAVPVFSGGKAEAAVEAIRPTPPGTYPMANQRVEITAFGALTARTDNFDYGVNDFSTWFTDKTNVEFKFITAPAADAKTRLNLLINAGDYPEVIFRQLSLGEMSMYGEEGILVPIDSYLDEYGYFIHDVLQEYPATRHIMTGEDGRMYGLPRINDCYHCLHNGRLWIYNPWFQELKQTHGIGTPSTTEEFRQYLRLIRDNDLNNTGRMDQIPLAANVTGMGRLQFFFMNSFMVYPHRANMLKIDANGNVAAAYMQPGYKEGLKYLHSLYAEGLILPEAFSITREEIRRIGENPEAVLIGSAPGHGPEDFVRKAGRAGRWEQYVTIPPLEGPTGIRNAMYQGQWYAMQPGFFITDKAKNPELAFRAGDFFLGNTEHIMNSYIGPLGESWDWADEGSLGIHGEPALYKSLLAYGTQRMNSSWDQMNHDYRGAYWRLSEQVPNSRRIMEYLDSGNVDMAAEMHDYPDYNEVMKYYVSVRDYHPHVYDESRILPPLVFGQDVHTEVADIEAVILPYVEEMFARFVTGDIDIDRGWDNYIRELRNMRVDRYLELYNQAYGALNVTW